MNIESTQPPLLILALLSSFLYGTINDTFWKVGMGTVVANDLKTKGIKAIKEALMGQLEAPISVRGQIKYVVMGQQQYQYLRECALEATFAKSRTDLAGGRFVKESVAQHIKRLKQINKAI